MKLVILCLILPFPIFSQIPDELGKEYILSNKIKSVTTIRDGTVKRIDKYDIGGNLIQSKRIYALNFYELFSASYDSLSNLIMEATAYVRNDTVERKFINKYETVYKNGKLIKWIYPAERDTVFYLYHNSTLVKEEFINRAYFDRIFGGGAPQVFPSGPSYLIKYAYDYDFNYNYNELIYKNVHSNKSEETSIRYFYNEIGDPVTVIEIWKTNYLKHDYEYNEYGRLSKILISGKTGNLAEKKFTYKGHSLESFMDNKSRQFTFSYEFW